MIGFARPSWPLCTPAPCATEPMWFRGGMKNIMNGRAFIRPVNGCMECIGAKKNVRNPGRSVFWRAGPIWRYGAGWCGRICPGGAIYIFSRIRWRKICRFPFCCFYARKKYICCRSPLWCIAGGRARLFPREQGRCVLANWPIGVFWRNKCMRWGFPGAGYITGRCVWC